MGSRSAMVLPEVEDDTSNQLQPLYHVILLNDEDHTYDYVIEMLQKIFGFTESKALSHTVDIHLNPVGTQRCRCRYDGRRSIRIEEHTGRRVRPCEIPNRRECGSAG